MSSRRGHQPRFGAAPVAALLLFLLTACGFSPVYQDRAAGEGLAGRVEIAPIDGLAGFTFREQLIRQFGLPSGAEYDLRVDLTVEREGIGITQSNDITRYNLTGTATYRLTERATGAAAAEGQVRTFTAYSATSSAYATRVARRDAEKRLAISLADQLAVRLAATVERPR
ncbi:LPS assembly lipoprotein LptE [Oceanomicrobium pacificus]|uniref:LPS-assembly lipoprotein n=1 Tax=Oceanomicrobium pacificus TaxID=2692916 RepID=A0A6B0TUB4_9RHOB|nr:LPS assembly lipoprotein LptE [Oceanomicrobium pacificus]MXU64832.1 hypothetical protein [Oceanomicrobium pacificus]